MCSIFVVRGVRRKYFHAEFFPNYGIIVHIKGVNGLATSTVYQSVILTYVAMYIEFYCIA